MPMPKNPEEPAREAWNTDEPGLAPSEKRSKVTGKVYRSGGSRLRDSRREELRRQEIDADPPKCGYCSKVIPAPRRYGRNVGYCRALCQRRMAQERNKLAEDLKKLQADQSETDEGIFYDEELVRRGHAYKQAKLQLTEDEITMWLNRDYTDAQIGKRLGYSGQTMTRTRHAFHNDRLREAQSDEHTVADEYLELLGPSDQTMRELLAENPEKFEAMLDALVTAFMKWRDTFFRSSPDATYITKAVHRRWIKSILRTIYTGGRTMILSPPRHGKTDLLIHFCVWLICRNPNIRILWVGPNGDIADNSLGDVKDTLESNEPLKTAYLAPGQSWKPTERGSGMWQAGKFKVANRTLQRKQPTMWSTGVGGKITSLDADFIIVDDPADPDDSQQPAGREKISKWFRMKLITRKMNHTGLAVISSRVHVEDLYSEILENEKWEVLIDSAHDPVICGLDLFDSHDHLEDMNACILFPELNPLSYLRDQHDDVGGPLFDMMYLNKPRPEGTAIFDIDRIRTECLDRSRDVGVRQIPGSYHLIAGLDPAARGIQAAYLWAIDVPNDTDYMVDLDAESAGGIEGALRIMRAWHELYDLRIWVVEDNSYQSVFFDDPRVKELKLELGLTIVPVNTGANKHDPDFGVSGMAPRFHAGKVNLPYATVSARRKTEMYLKQLAAFTGATGRSKKKSDILMASWFPHAEQVRKWRKKEKRNRVHTTEARSFEGFGYDDLSVAPWQTNYPG